MNDLVERARRFATAAHASIGQRRKYSQLPYDVHLQAVAGLVAAVSDDPALAAAAWLHDTVEDTPTILEDIRREFGDDVAGLVCELTDVSKPGDGNRAARKALDGQHLSAVSARAKTVKLADIIDNCADICSHDPAFGRVYLAEAQGLLKVLGEGDARLFGQAAATVAEWSRKIGPAAPAAADTITGSLRGQRGLRLFVDGFAARDILEPIPSYDDGSLAALFARPADRPASPVIGVRTGGRVTGYLLAEDFKTASPSDVRPIDPRQRMELDTQMADVIQTLSLFACCFVTVNDVIVGSITRADVEKPVVRMWLFGIIILVEMLVVGQVRGRWPDGSWRERVSEGRLAKALALQEERRRRGRESDLLDCLQFADKFQLLLREPEFVRQTGFPSAAAAKEALKDLEALRNDLAHGQDIAEHDWAPIVRLAQRIQRLLGI